MKIRIQKHLSEQGILSRRKTEEYLKKGWITVNGKTVKELGTKIDPAVDKIEFSDNVKAIQSNYITIAFHKPKGIVTNLPQKNEKEIVNLLPKELNP